MPFSGDNSIMWGWTPEERLDHSSKHHNFPFILHLSTLELIGISSFFSFLEYPEIECSITFLYYLFGDTHFSV